MHDTNQPKTVFKKRKIFGFWFLKILSLPYFPPTLCESTFVSRCTTRNKVVDELIGCLNVQKSLIFPHLEFSSVYFIAHVLKLMYIAAIRSGDYYMFEEYDDDEELELIGEGEESDDDKDVKGVTVSQVTTVLVITYL